MKARLRQGRILDQLAEQPACTYEHLTRLLGVSTMTIRRDVDEMAARGWVIKTVGGVHKASSSPLLETALISRLSENIAEKRAIAEEAAGLIGERGTLFLDGGSTCVALARHIAQAYQGLTVVTNSAMVCIELGQNNNNAAIGIGGDYDPDSLSFLGPASEEWVSRFHVEVAFFSTKGFVPEEGTFESSTGLIRIKQIVARQCDELVLLADHSKFGKRALCKVLDTSQLHAVVTDEQAPPASISSLEESGCRLHLASSRLKERHAA